MKDKKTCFFIIQGDYIKSNKFLIVLIILLAGCILVSSSTAADIDVQSIDSSDSYVSSIEQNNLNDLNDSNVGAGTISAGDDKSVTNLKAKSADDNTDKDISKLGATKTFSDLNKLIQADTTGTVTLSADDIYKYVSSESTYKTGITINKPIVIDGKGCTIDGSGLARALNITANNVIIKNINFINTNSSRGGAIYWISGEHGVVSGCTFINTYSSNSGGAIYGANVVSNCTFINTSTLAYSGAIYLYGENGVVSDCTFINTSASSSGGAIRLYGKNITVSDCSFTYCTSDYGGAVYWQGANGTVSDCTFTNCSAKSDGGAVYWHSESVNGTVNACNFTNCTSGYGGAILWDSAKGTVSNSSFINCSATTWGAAICWFSGVNGSVSGCTFSNTTASYGGAIRWSGVNGSVSGCTFTNSNASYGGAIQWNSANGNVSNCTFSNTTASYGGAIYWNSSDNGVVSDCTFTNTNAFSGGAIYWDYGVNGSVSGCTFSNTTSSNMGGAVYSIGTNSTVKDCTFINTTSSNVCGAVSWSGVNGTVNNCNFTNTKASTTGGAIQWHGANGTVSDCTFSNTTASKGNAIYIFNVASLNITDCSCNSTDDKAPIYNDGTILSKVVITTLDGADKTVAKGSNINLTANVTTSDLLVAGGILILNYNGTEKTANFTDEGLYYVPYTANTLGIIPVTAIYLNATNNYDVNSYKLIVILEDSFTQLAIDIANSGNELVLNHSYHYYPEYDSEYVNGIVLNKTNFVIDGNGFTIDAINSASVFNITANNVTINNLNFINTKGNAIYMNINGNVSDCNFTNCSGYNGSAIYIKDKGTVSGCSFTNCSSDIAGAIYMDLGSNVKECTFENCSSGRGGAIFMSSNNINQPSGKVSDCNFTNCFVNSGYFEGGAIFIWYGGSVSGCTFENCSTTGKGGAIFGYAPGQYYGTITIKYSILTNCSAKYGGAIYFDGHYLVNGVVSVSGSNFTNCSAERGSAIYTSEVNMKINGCNCIPCSGDNKAPIYHNGTISSEVVITTLNGSNMPVNYGDTVNLTANVTASGIPVAGGIVTLKVNGTDRDAYSNDEGLYSTKSGDEYTVDFFGIKPVTATYLNATDNQTVNAYNLTVSVPEDSFTQLAIDIANSGNELVLNHSYRYYPEYDSEYVNGIVLNKTNFVIDGNGFTIDGNNSARVFNIISSNVTIKNINFINTYAIDGGSAIYIANTGSLNITNSTCTPIDNKTPIYNDGTILSDVVITTLNGSNMSVTFDDRVILTANVTASGIPVAGGIVTLKVNGTDRDAYSNDKGLYFAYYDVKFVGVEPVNATYRNATGNQIVNVYNITSVPVVLDINVSINNSVYDENITGCINTTHEGNITLTIDGNNFTGEVIDCNFIITDVTGINAGFYTNIPVSFISDDGGYIGNTLVNFDRYPKSIPVNASLNGTYGSNITGVINATNKSGNVTVIINNVSYAAKVTDGKFTLNNTDSLNVGYYHDVVVRFVSEDGNFGGSDIIDFTISFKIIPLNASLNGTYGSNITGTIDNDGRTGNVSVTINGTVYNGTVDSEGLFILNDTDSLNAGYYKDIPVSFISDDGNVVGDDIINFTINRKKINMTAIVDNITYGDNLSGSVDADVFGWIDVHPGEGPISYLFNRTGPFTTEWNETCILSPGTYTAHITFISNDWNYQGEANVTYIISKATPVVNITVEPITYGDVEVVNITVVGLDGKAIPSGNVTIFVNGIEYANKTLSDGKCNCSISTLVGGVNNITVLYNGDDIYNSSENSANVTVKTVSPKNITIGVDNITYGENATVNVTVIGLDGKAVPTGNVTILVNGSEVANVTLVDGKCNCSISTLVGGVNNITVVYNGDNNYTNTENSVNVTVKTLNPKNITIDVDNIDYGDDAVVNVTVIGLDGRAVPTGNVTILVNGSEVANVTLVEGKCNCSILNLNVGIYNITVVYNGDNNYNGSNSSANVTVRPVPAQDINIAVNTPEYGDDAVVNVTVIGLDGRAVPSGNVTIFVNGTEYANRTLSDGECNCSILNLNAGDYNITVVYNGDNNYTRTVNSAILTVIPKAINMSAVIYNATYGDDTVSGKVNASMNGTVYISLHPGSSRPIEVTVNESGEFTIPLKLPVGVRSNVSVTFLSADGNYMGGARVNITVNKAIPELNVYVGSENSSDIKYGDTVLGIASLPLDATGNVSFSVDNDTWFTVPVDELALAEFKFPGLDAGNYVLFVKYNGDNNYSSVSSEKPFTINKVDPQVTVDIGSEESFDIKFGDTVLGIVSVPDDATGVVYFSLDNETWIHVTIPKKGSLVEYDIPDLDVGNYILFVKYSGDKKYNPVYSENLFTVDQLNTIVTVDPVKGKAGEKVNITVRVTDERGIPVEEGTVIIGFNGKEYKANVVNGIATIEVTLPNKAGNYSATAYYEGFNYNSSYTTFTVEVSDIPGPIPDPDPVNPVGNMENTGNPLLVLLIALAAIGLESFRRKF